MVHTAQSGSTVNLYLAHLEPETCNFHLHNSADLCSVSLLAAQSLSRLSRCYCRCGSISCPGKMPPENPVLATPILRTQARHAAVFALLHARLRSHDNTKTASFVGLLGRTCLATMTQGIPYLTLLLETIILCQQS